MATLFERITGKTENELAAKIEELEKELTAAQEKIVSLEEQVASLEKEAKEAKREVFNLTKTIQEKDKTIATLENSNRGFSQKIAELTEQHTAVVTEATELKRSLSVSEESKLEAEAKLAATEAKLAETKTLLESSWRSLELGKIAEDGVLPGKEEIEKLRTDVYTEYFNAQEHIISDLIRSNCSFDGTMKLEISKNESFMLHTGNSYRLFVCTKLIEKLCVGKDGYWEVILNFNKMTESLTDFVCRLSGGCPMNFSVRDFPSSKYTTPIHDEQTIVQISPIEGTYPETVLLEMKYHPHSF